MVVSDSTSFARIFRKEIYDGVEYSFSLDPQTYGTMIAGLGESFMKGVREFAQTLPYAAGFLNVIDQFTSHIVTDAYLFKVDWSLESAERLSLYFRFIHGVPQKDLDSAFEHAHPLHWQGPPPRMIGEAIQAGDPVIVGLRVNKKGVFQSSVYYNYFEGGNRQFIHQILEPLVQLLEWDSGLSKSISKDVTTLLYQSPHAAIGFDSASATKPVMLKIAAANVSWEQVVTSFSKKDVPKSRMEELAIIGRRLRQLRLNYAAMKFGPSGFLGWKLYWAVLARGQSSASATRVVLS